MDETLLCEDARMRLCEDATMRGCEDARKVPAVAADPGDIL